MVWEIFQLAENLKVDGGGKSVEYSFQYQSYL
ncbi:unnamed protein product [Schistosoma margrebowiei]|uniref:Uncharacterized protein n=1 Tax=Schistosoma margrebowiei TaxID=48269 RepID=A0A3P7ZJ74_9TREM|nr:unnamed protein product [Schistosoma margrebowiei]